MIIILSSALEISLLHLQIEDEKGKFSVCLGKIKG